MCITTPLPVVPAFGDERHEALMKDQRGAGLSRRPSRWRSLCRRGLLVAPAVGGAKCERARLGHDSLAAFSWLVRNSQMPGGVWRHTRLRGLLAT